MKLHECLLTKNDCYIAGKTIVPKGIMVHSTGANNPTLRRYVQPDDGQLGGNPNQNSWNRSGVGACVHAFIGKLKDGTIATYQTLPWTMRGWHAGGAANNTHIAFEICEDGLKDATYFNAVYREAVELCAYLCRQYALDPLKDGVLLDHSEGSKRGIASNHGDVGHWFTKHGKTMDDFRRAVAQELKPSEKEPEQNEPETPAVRFRYLSQVSSYYKPTLQKLIGKGLFAGKSGEGDNRIIDLSEDACRVLTVLDRAGLFGA